MTADLPTNIREALHEGDIGAHQLRRPVLHAPEPRRDRRWTVTVAVVTVVLVIAGVSAVVAARRHREAAHPSPQPSVAVVPWNPVGVRPDNGGAPNPRDVLVPRTVRPCMNADFAATTAPVSTTTQDQGELTTAFTLRLVGATACALDQRMNADLLDAHGRTLPNDYPVSAGPAFPPLLALPGQLVMGAVTWFVYQGRAKPPTHIALYPGDSVPKLRIEVSVGGVNIPPHPADWYHATVWRSGNTGNLDRVATDGGLSALDATYSGPSRVALGTTLRYRITLTNRGTKAVSLRSCPGFVEQLAVIPIKFATVVGRRGPLNCVRAPAAIAVDGAVTFAFELPTTGQILGPGHLTWQLVDNDKEVIATVGSVTTV